MRSLLFLMLSAATLAAQTGSYNFVELSVRGSGAALDVRNAGGTLTISGAQATFTGQSGAGTAATAAFNAQGSYSGGQLTNPLISGATLDVHASADANVLIGSSATPASKGDSYDLFIAVRQSAATPTVTGNYSAAYFAVNGATASGLVSAFLNFSAAPGAWSNVLLGGHTAARDDVNREEQPTGIAFSLGAGGAGVVRFPPGSDYLSGDRDILVSADGAWMLGYSRAAGQRDIFIAQRRDGDRSAASLDSLYWMAELGAEEPFAFDAAQVRWSGAEGTLRSDANGRAEIAEQTARQRSGTTSNIWVSTANAYYADPNGRAALVPALTADRQRNNFNFNLDGFIGAQVGTPGAVTLEHGIFAGAKAGNPSSGPVSLTQLGAFNGASFAIGPVSPLSYITLFGTNLASATAVAASYPFPTDLAGTHVLVNGTPAPLQSVSAGQINVQWPAGNGPTATVQVSAAAGLSNTLTVPVAASSPGVFRGAVLHADYSPVTTSAPARPSETLIVYAAGLGAVNPPVAAGVPAGAAPLSRTTDATLRAYVAGTAAIVEFSGLAPGFAGLYQLNVRVPDDAVNALAAPLGISLADSFTDIAEIAITR